MEVLEQTVSFTSGVSHFRSRGHEVRGRRRPTGVECRKTRGKMWFFHFIIIPKRSKDFPIFISSVPFHEIFDKI